MPNFYLRHAVFGAKVAISDVEMAADVENGWEEFDPAARNEEPAARNEEPAEPVRKGRRKLKDVPNFLASVTDEGD